MKLTTLILLFAFSTLWVQSQNDTPLENDIKLKTPWTKPSGGDEVDQVPLKFHVLRDGPVWFDDTTRVDDLIDTINVTFSPANIEFVKCGNINYIYDEEYTDGWDPATVLFGVQADNIQENVINVFIPNSTITSGGYSFSKPLNQWEYGVQYNAVVMSGTLSLDSRPYLLTHELGHYFGLYHTSGTQANPELVNGSNCDTAGDYCCDTPAEYDLMCCADIEICEYVPLNGIYTDANNDTLNPDVNNFMSSMPFNVNCREQFTDDQYTRIRYYYENYLSELDCSGTLGIEENKQFHFKIGPNPVNEVLHIDANSDLTTFQFVIFNMVGEVVYKMSGSPRIDISHLPNGVYLLAINNGSKLAKAMKFVKI